jgi:hypothetical protein
MDIEVGKVLVWIMPGFSFFKLVAPPFQPGVVELYPVHGTWFLNHLPLEGTDHIQIFRL